jgi:beta-carotene/zeaxanthin 4-ketolase
LIESTAIFLSPAHRERSGQNGTLGVVVAGCIISLWAISLIVLLQLDIPSLPVWVILLAMFGQTFLYTGLFITAHDAMHGSIYPKNPSLNHAIGRLAVICYAAFSYQKLLKNHWLHHHHPASSLDPDFHDGQHDALPLWYFRFMFKYWGWKQFVALSTVFQVLHYLLDVSQTNLILFWMIPAILSSGQLFYFGTYLTHREPKAGYTNLHRAQTLPLPTFWSFITCYHFGYHQEHHQYPHVSWWQLPTVHRMQVSGIQEQATGSASKFESQSCEVKQHSGVL